MSSDLFNRSGPSSRGTRSFYEQLRACDDDVDIEDQAGLNVDEENLRHNLNDFDTEGLTVADTRVIMGSTAFPTKAQVPKRMAARLESSSSRSQGHEDDMDNDVPASLLFELNEHEPLPSTQRPRTPRNSRTDPTAISAGQPSKTNRNQWQSGTAPHRLRPNGAADAGPAQPRSLVAGVVLGDPREKALWRWVNTSNLDSFMRDVYDYYEGGGIWCILCSNALWLL